MQRNGVEAPGFGRWSRKSKKSRPTGQATGVVVNGSGSGVGVVSNSNIKSTILKLIGPEHFDPAYVEETQAVRLNNSSCQVYIALKPGEAFDDLEISCSTRSTGGSMRSPSEPQHQQQDILLLLPAQLVGKRSVSDRFLDECELFRLGESERGGVRRIEEGSGGNDARLPRKIYS